MSKRPFQIGVMGSASDLKFSKKAEKLAVEIGEMLADQDAIVVFGAEKDSDSLSTIAARTAKKSGGTTLGVTYGKHKDIWTPEDASIIVPCGLERGGGRETVLVLSCDAVIAIAGGSGTLTEMAIAYQADIPIVGMEGLEGWSAKLAGEPLDGRNRLQVRPAKTAEDAVKLALEEATKYRERHA